MTAHDHLRLQPRRVRWPSRAVLGEGAPLRGAAATATEIAECDTKEAIGTMLVQLDEDGEIVTCLAGIVELRRRLVG